jgi:hypothetical protein
MFAQPPHEFDDAHVAQLDGGDDEIEVAFAVGEAQGFLARAGMAKPRRGMRFETEEPAEDAFGRSVRLRSG